MRSQARFSTLRGPGLGRVSAGPSAMAGPKRGRRDRPSRRFGPRAYLRRRRPMPSPHSGYYRSCHDSSSGLPRRRVPAVFPIDDREQAGRSRHCCANGGDGPGTGRAHIPGCDVSAGVILGLPEGRRISGKRGSEPQTEEIRDRVLIRSYSRQDDVLIMSCMHEAFAVHIAGFRDCWAGQRTGERDLV